MSGASPAPADPDRRVRQVELLISVLLRVGVSVSLVTIILGTVVTFANHPDFIRSPASLPQAVGVHVEFPHTVHDVITSAVRGSGEGIVMLGLFLLIATPVMRVAVSVAAFAYERDRTFVGITTIVLLLLLLSFFLGRIEG